MNDYLVEIVIVDFYKIKKQLRKEPIMTKSRKTQEDIFYRVAEVLEEYNPKDCPKILHPYDRLAEDLNCDSLDILQIGFSLRERFNIDLIPMLEETRPQYVTDLVALVCRGIEIPYETPPCTIRKKANSMFNVYRENPGRV